VSGWSDVETITITVIAFFLVLALLTFARTILRRMPPTYRRLRVGIFVERDNGDEPKKKEEQ
jgi:hypothetical protein